MYKPIIQHRNAIMDRIKADSSNGNYNGNRRYEHRWFGNKGNAQKPAPDPMTKAGESMGSNIEKREQEKIEERIRQAKENLKEDYYQKTCIDNGFKEFHEAYVKAVKLAESEVSEGLKKYTFTECMAKLAKESWKRYGDSPLSSIIRERGYARLFMTPDGRYAVNGKREPLTLDEALNSADVRVTEIRENQVEFVLIPQNIQ